MKMSMIAILIYIYIKRSSCAKRSNCSIKVRLCSRCHRYHRLIDCRNVVNNVLVQSKCSLLLLLALLINRHVEVHCGFGRRSHKRFYCHCGRLGRAVKKVVGVMRRMTAVVAMVSRCRVYFINVLTKDVNGAQLCQNSSCPPWQCLFGCSNGRRSAIKQF